MALRQDEVIPRIEYARRLLGLSQDAAYVEYRMAGGSASGGSFERWHRGINPPPADDYLMIAEMYDEKLKKARESFRVLGRSGDERSYWVETLTGISWTNRTFAETAA